MHQLWLGATLAAMTGVGGLLGGIGAAQAATFGLDTTGTASQNVSLDKFDPSLGTLNAVDITLANSATGGEATAIVTNGSDGEFSQASESGTLAITGPGGATLFSASTSDSAGCIVHGSGTAGCSTHGPQDSPSFSPDPVHITSNLAAFEGTGTFDLTAAIAGVTSDLQPPAHGVAAANLEWSGDLSVSYEFTPLSAVPEPASLALLGLGLVGLAVSRRSRI